MDCSGPIIMWVWLQKFAEKTLLDGFETAKKYESFLPQNISAIRYDLSLYLT